MSEREDPEEDGRIEELDDLLVALARAAPDQRIDFRDSILAFGLDCVAPLMTLAGQHPKLDDSVSAWLEHLIKTDQDPDAGAMARAALRHMAAKPGGSIAKQALARLAARDKERASASNRRGHREKSAACEAVHTRLIDFARMGQTVFYSELETSRGHIGKYLYTISREEADAGRPPLTSIVIGRQTRRPGDGYILAMIDVGFARPGEDVDEVWQRAKTAVFDYWKAAAGG